MERRGFNVRLLSAATGISTATIYHYLHGRREMHLDDLRAVGAALQVRPSWIAWG